MAASKLEMGANIFIINVLTCCHFCSCCFLGTRGGGGLVFQSLCDGRTDGRRTPIKLSYIRINAPRKWKLATEWDEMAKMERERARKKERYCKWKHEISFLSIYSLPSERASDERFSISILNARAQAQDHVCWCLNSPSFSLSLSL